MAQPPPTDRRRPHGLRWPADVILALIVGDERLACPFDALADLLKKAAAGLDGVSLRMHVRDAALADLGEMQHAHEVEVGGFDAGPELSNEVEGGLVLAPGGVGRLGGWGDGQGGDRLIGGRGKGRATRWGHGDAPRNTANLLWLIPNFMGIVTLASEDVGVNHEDGCEHQMSVSGNQIKAARALIGLEQAELAAKAGVSINTVRNMEAAGGDEVRVRSDTLFRVQEALKVAGVLFVEENGDGPGVRMRKKPKASGK